MVFRRSEFGWPAECAALSDVFLAQAILVDRLAQQSVHALEHFDVYVLLLRCLVWSWGQARPIHRTY